MFTFDIQTICKVFIESSQIKERLGVGLGCGRERDALLARIYELTGPGYLPPDLRRLITLVCQTIAVTHVSPAFPLLQCENEKMINLG